LSEITNTTSFWHIDAAGGRPHQQQTKFAWSGPLNLKHVGFCSVDGPEEKTGELRLLVSEPAGEVTATLLIGGDACTFSARLKDGYEGVMHCPGRPDVPMMLFIQ
jgi:hypothetical protein